MGLFDSFPDWNGNGQPDPGDAFMDYMIAHQALGTPVNTDDKDDD